MINDWLVSYATRLEFRALADIDLVIMHCTELPDMQMAREYAERIQHAGPQTGNCGHRYIDRDGTQHRFVPLERVAHHCHDWNTRSIGIELVNRGRWPNWLDSRHQAFTEPYPATQIDALARTLQDLREFCPNLKLIAAHADLDVRTEPASDDPEIAVARRLDPGPLFPWPEVIMKSGLDRLTPPD